MEDIQKTKTELIAELQTLRDRLATSEATLQAIQQGEVDALVVATDNGTQIFTLQSADQSYRLLVEEMQQGAAILAKDGLIVYANSSLSKILQRPLEQLIGSSFQQFLPAQDALLFQDLIQVTQVEKRQALEMFMVRSDAVEIPVYMSIHHLNLNEVPMKCLVVTNLTEQKRHEQTLAAERLARLILEQAGEAIIVCDATGRIIRTSQAVNQLWDGNLLFKPFESLRPLYLTSVPGQSSDRIPFSIQSVLDGTTYQGTEVELEHPNGQVLSLVLNARPLADQFNHFTGAVLILTNITQRKQAELALKASQTQLQQQLAEIETIYQCAPIGLNVLDTELRFVRINQRLAEINGLSIEAHLGHTVRELLPDLADEAEQLLRHILETGEPCLNVEISGETPAQPGVQRTWLESFLPLKDGDRVIGINTVCEEITDRKRSELERQQVAEELRQAKQELENRVAERTAELRQIIIELEQAKAHITASLKEKEVLLKEIHHRVKNNLGIVNSLLQMQGRRIQNTQAAEIFQDSQNRIESIAMVHEKLYRSDDLANIDCAQYIRDLTVYLFDSYKINSNQIQLDIQVDNVRLDIETIIPCGLIINELVSNALKYAFPNDRTGEIRVRFFQTERLVQGKQQCFSTLTIKDNGIGLPDDVDIKKAKTLGLTLVQGLAKQIGGTIEVTRQAGTEFKLTFVRQ